MQMNNMDYFSPPFPSDLLKKRKKIRRELLESNRDYIAVRIAILGGSTTHDIREILDLFLLHHGISAAFYESEYAQYWQDAMFANPELEKFKPDIVYIHTSNRNVLRYPEPGMDAQEVSKLLDETVQHYSAAWERLSSAYGCPIIQNNFEYPFWRLQGNREASDCCGSVNFITRLNLRFAEYAQKHKNFYINDINYLSATYGLEQWSDLFAWYMYKYSLAVPAIPYLAHSIANIIKSLYGKNKKAFALDLDNTLWGGTVGDDGVDNLRIGQETAEGQAYSEFQKYLKAHKSLGILLSVVSKNEAENAMEGLNHPDMILTPGDFTLIKANWESKAKNLSDVAKALSMLPDSFVFVDDNPAEREIVRQQVNSAAVPEIGNHPECYIKAIDRMGYFEVTDLSQEDRARLKMYEQNAARAQEEASFASYDDYLRSLKMCAEIKCFTEVYYSRIAQLTNKTNQFNLTTRRYTQADISAMARNGNYITLYGKLMDKFGDNGVVSVVAGEVDESNLNIILWLMSCRVLKRGLEYAMMDALIECCKERKLNKVLGHYYPTAKNMMVRDFYKDQGFHKIAEEMDGHTVWEIDVKSYEKRNNMIEICRGRFGI